jgi:hypothetical protein
MYSVIAIFKSSVVWGLFEYTELFIAPHWGAQRIFYHPVIPRSSTFSSATTRTSHSIVISTDNGEITCVNLMQRHPPPPVPPHVHIDFVVPPTGCGRSETDF